MASLYMRGKTWWLRCEVNGRLIRESLGTRDKQKAQLALKARVGDVTRLRAAKRMGLEVPEDARDARVTLAVFLDRYKTHFLNAGGGALRKSRENTWRADVSALKPALTYLAREGLSRVVQVTRRHIEGFRDWRVTATVLRAVEIPAEELAKMPKRPGPKPKKPLTRLEPRAISGATVNKSLRVGKAAWSYAVRMGYAKANPFVGVKPVKTPRYDPRNLSEFEVRRLLEAADGERLRPLVATMVYSGLRCGELLALEWPDLDFETNLIRVGCDETFLTKSRRARLVPLWLEKLREILHPIKKPLGLVFTTAEGEPLDYANVRKAVIRIGDKAKITDFSPHDLRRTFASILATKGVPTSRIRDYLGHASVATTEGYYLARGQLDHADVAKLAFGNGPRNGHKNGHSRKKQEPRKPAIA